MSGNEPSPTESPAEPRRALSLLDSTSIIVGIIIGSAIYEISPVVARSAGGWAAGLLEWSRGSPPAANELAIAGTAAILGVWIVGGLVALLGAICYAELATAYPHAGGTYVYLSEALGRSVGFAFAWTEFWIVRPGNIGAVAFVLARYGVQLLPPSAAQIAHIDLGLAVGSILILSVLNAAGLRAGKWTQNVLTVSKVVGLAAIIVTALTITKSGDVAPPTSASGNLALALILIMFAYGGWADMSFVAAEVRDPAKNIFRALLLGTAAVVVIYVAINIAFVQALGLGGLASSQAVAAEVLARRFGRIGSSALSLLVVLSCLGAINGMLLTGARVFYAVGIHHPSFRWLGAWNVRTGVPLRSLAMQSLVTIGLVIGFGLRPGGFEGLVVFTGFFYWTFIGLVGIAVIVLRWFPRAEATFRLPLFPLTPLAFWLTCFAMAYAAAQYTIGEAVRSLRDTGRLELTWTIGAAWAVIVVVSGLGMGLFDWQKRRR